MNKERLKKKITDLKICVLIPTYNNQRTLKHVIDGVLNYTNNILIVNDGSTDSTSGILEEYSYLKPVFISENKGKGNALRVGFNKAIELGYEYAITIDSDGQHFPDDIAVFVNALEQNKTKNVLLIGSRNMSQEGVPKKSSFGNKFSNFWFWFETQIKLQDTQSGFRLYPLNSIKNLKLFTNKFEYEIEIIVKAAWKDVSVKNVPIKVHYDEIERVSHFRPFKDFTRISILNTWLVFLALIWFIPRNLFRRVKKKGLKRFFIEDLLGSQDSNSKKALSIALGIFIGLSPVWGFHTVIVIFLAVVFKLNKTIAFAFSNISIPPFIPFILYASSKMGQFILGVNYNYTLETFNVDFEIGDHLKTYIIGSFSLAIICASFFGFVGLLLFSLFKKENIIIKNG